MNTVCTPELYLSGSVSAIWMFVARQAGRSLNPLEKLREAPPWLRYVHAIKNSTADLA